MNPPPGFRHGEIQLALGSHLRRHVLDHDLGIAVTDAGFLVEQDTGRCMAPDVAFVSKTRVREESSPAGHWTGAPDLCVEILSPGDRYSQVLGKIQDWLGYGTRMVVLVEPQRRQLVVYRSIEDSWILGEDDFLDGGDVVPGWQLRIAELFD